VNRLLLHFIVVAVCCVPLFLQNEHWKSVDCSCIMPSFIYLLLKDNLKKIKNRRQSQQLRRQRFCNDKLFMKSFDKNKAHVTHEGSDHIE